MHVDLSSYAKGWEAGLVDVKEALESEQASEQAAETWNRAKLVAAYRDDYSAYVFGGEPSEHWRGAVDAILAALGV